jgi:hypothetical protein
MKNQKPSPCPLCGSEAGRGYRGLETDNDHWVSCLAHTYSPGKCDGLVIKGGSKEMALDRWEAVAAFAGIKEAVEQGVASIRDLAVRHNLPEAHAIADNLYKPLVRRNEASRM